MSACYSCHAILNKKNQSFEHIIPNAIGGVLKSARLICKACNSAYGMTIDAALAKDFEHLAARYNIGRDRPKSRMIQNTIASNADLYHLQDGQTPPPAKPMIRLDKDQLYISGPDKKQLMQIASGLKSKFPNIDLDNIEKNWEADDALPEGELTINFSAGSDLFMRSVAKIAVNYYLMKVRGRHYLDKIINVINGVDVNHKQIYYYPLRANIWGDGELSHVIMIKGNNISKKLQANVILFNTHSFAINLCDHYDGCDIDFFYRYELLRRQEIKG
ncbi:MAG TPA: HNH endonuclease [Chitinophagaceae bacterium]|nr:HNH endonuclease [Chitinophagaceae bacterium]